MKDLKVAFWKSKFLFSALSLVALLLTYQACSQEEFTANRLLALSSKGQMFNLEKRYFPTCSNDRTLVFTYLKSPQEQHLCYDNTRLASNLSQGPVCNAGPAIKNFSTAPSNAVPCLQATICGVSPQVVEIAIGQNAKTRTKAYRLTYSALPLACTGTLRIEDKNKNLLMELDIETPGTKEAVCQRCTSSEYSCECASNSNSKNGVCGSSHGALLSSIPTNNLCLSGTPSQVIERAGIFEWSCFGSSGGSNDQCKANNSSFIGGICGSAHGQSFAETPTVNLCERGSPSGVQLNGNTYLWQCSGANGAPSATCNATKPGFGANDGKCGSSHGQVLSAPPSDDLCNAGTPTSITSNVTTYNWSCVSTSGGASVPCEAAILPDFAIGSAVQCSKVASANGNVLPSNSFLKAICTSMSKSNGILVVNQCATDWVKANNLGDSYADSCIKYSAANSGLDEGYNPPQGTALHCTKVKQQLSEPPSQCEMESATSTALKSCATGWKPTNCLGATGIDCCVRVEEVTNPSSFRMGDTVYCAKLIANNNRVPPPAPCLSTLANGKYSLTTKGCDAGWSFANCVGSDTRDCCIKTSP